MRYLAIGLTLLLFPFLAFAYSPEVPDSWEAWGALLAQAIHDNEAVWAFVSAVLMALAQVLKGKTGKLPFISEWIEARHPALRLALICLFIVGAFSLSAIPDGVEAIVMAFLAGVKTAAGAVFAHQLWTLTLNGGKKDE